MYIFDDIQKIVRASVFDDKVQRAYQN